MRPVSPNYCGYPRTRSRSPRKRRSVRRAWTARRPGPERGARDRSTTRSRVTCWCASPTETSATPPTVGSCDGAAFVYSARHPAAVDTVTASGQPTVYLAANTANSRIGYLALDAKDSAQAAEQTHGPTGVPYYVIGEIPSDNDQSVLVSLLQQYSMP